MRLSLLDRYKLIKRAVALALNPKIQATTFLWVSNDNPDEVVPHSIYADGTSSTAPMFQYFARVASIGTLEDMQARLAGMNLVALKHFCKTNNKDYLDYGVLKYPVRYIKGKEPVETTTTVLVAHLE